MITTNLHLNGNNSKNFLALSFHLYFICPFGKFTQTYFGDLRKPPRLEKRDPRMTVFYKIGAAFWWNRKCWHRQEV